MFGRRSPATPSKAWISTRPTDLGRQRFGLRSGNGIPAWALAISAARAAASSLGGGGPDSLLARALRIGAGMLSALNRLRLEAASGKHCAAFLRELRHGKRPARLAGPR